MKSFLLIPALLSLLSISLLAQPENTSDSKQLMQDFRRQTESWKEAYNSGNAQNFVTLYAVDAQYISSHVEGLVAPGRDRLTANFQNGMNLGGHMDSIEILKMDVSCDLATLLCKYQATNSGVTVTGRNLLVMKKINGVWLIILHMTVV